MTDQATDRDLDTLARTIYGEARGEGEFGMQAVACVIMNRVHASAKKPQWWGVGIDGVCLKPGQYSCWNADDINRPIIEAVTEAEPVFALATAVAAKAAAGTLDDITNGATHYYDRRMPEEPYWARGIEPCAVIGHHKFYKGV
jgi:N-acetylmuramoyl-L-alanine amidase